MCTSDSARISNRFCAVNDPEKFYFAPPASSRLLLTSLLLSMPSCCWRPCYCQCPCSCWSPWYCRCPYCSPSFCNNLPCCSSLFSVKCWQTRDWFLSSWSLLVRGLVKRLRGFIAAPHQGKFQSDHEDGHTLLQKVVLRLDSRESWDNTELEFLNNLWGKAPSRNGVIVPARQAT